MRPIPVKPLACLVLLFLVTGVVPLPTAGAALPNDPFPPITPIGPSPPDGASGIGPLQTLSWTGGDLDGDTVTSTVTAKVNGGSSYVACVTTTTNCTASFPYSSVITWQVTAQDQTHSVTGSWWTFTTKGAPYPASNPSPANGAMSTPRNVTLTWNDSDPNGYALTYTVVLMGPDNVTTTPCMAVSDRTCRLGLVAPAAGYRWQVRANDSYNETAGPNWTFTTAPDVVPTAPAPVLPANDALRVDPLVTFRWNGSMDGDGDAIRYYVMIDGVGGLDNAVCSSAGLTCSAKLPLNVTYSWLVRADDGYEYNDSPGQSFSIRNDTPPQILTTTPTDDARDVGWAPTLAWTSTDADGDALTYTVELAADRSPSTPSAQTSPRRHVRPAFSSRGLGMSGASRRTTGSWRSPRPFFPSSPKRAHSPNSTASLP